MNSRTDRMTVRQLRDHLGKIDDRFLDVPLVARTTRYDKRGRAYRTDYAALVAVYGGGRLSINGEDFIEVSAHELKI